MKKFNKSERGKFRYWFAHWCSFQMVALLYGMWKPKYLLHDIEKPWLMLLWRNDYSRVQKWHREHANHHLEYGKGMLNMDIEATLIDWECSRFTKEAAPKTALETYNIIYEKSTGYKRQVLEDYFLPVLKKYDGFFK